MPKLTTSFSEGFRAISANKPRCLVLGSMPGEASLNAVEYYAHPRNAFWPIMAKLYNFNPDLDYESRCAEIANNGVMLWDVLHKAQRKGSLDSAIQQRSMVINDFSFLSKPSSVEVVFCNGGKAYDIFSTKVKKPLGLNLPVEKLPSTSPAYAAMRFEEKLNFWQAAFEKYGIAL